MSKAAAAHKISHASPAEGKLECPRHGAIEHPVVLPGVDGSFCPICMGEFLERSSVRRLVPAPSASQDEGK